MTYRQVGYWRDKPTFWTHIIAVTEPNYVAEINLGQYLFSADRFDEAAAHFRSALAIRPNGPTARLDLGVYEDRRGNFPAAIENYKAVIDRAGDVGMRAMAYGNLGFVYRQMGQTRDAKQYFERSLQTDTSRARARIGLGLLAQENGEPDEAVREFALAAASEPSEVVYLLLARASQQNGHPEEAKAIYERLAQSPNLPAAEKEVESLLLKK
jgi:tetratricopeptide (TPR) repeat protein